MTYLPLPYVYVRDCRGEKAWDIYSRLLKDRIVFVGTPIDDFVANAVIGVMHHHSGLNSHDVARQDSQEINKCVCSTTQDTSDWIEGEIASEQYLGGEEA